MGRSEEDGKLVAEVGPANIGNMGRSEEDGKLVAEVGPANMCTKTCVKLGRTMYVASCEEIGSHFHMYIRD